MKAATLILLVNGKTLMITSVPNITGYHAHIYYTDISKHRAETIRTQLDQEFSVTLGRWHDRPIGPHTQAMFQVVFQIQDFGSIIPWLLLNRQSLDILVHPETGDDLKDHTVHAIWLGDKLDLDLSKF